MPLFERGGLLQDVGRISERWGQDGSELFNLYDQVSGDTTAHTVTAGKTFYCSQLTVQARSPGVATNGINVRDAAAVVTRVDTAGLVLSQAIILNYNTPLKFTTDINYEELNAVNLDVTMSGWEE